MEDVTLWLKWLFEQPLTQLVRDLIALISVLIVCVIQIRKFNFQKKESEEKLKYRNEDYLKGKRIQQSFKSKVPEYDYDEKDNCLVQVGEKDLQALVQSSIDCALDRVFAKFGFLPDGQSGLPLKGSNFMTSKASPTGDYVDLSELKDDLSLLSDLNEDLSYLRERYNLPDATASELLAKINSLKSDVEKKQSEGVKNDEESLS